MKILVLYTLIGAFLFFIIPSVCLAQSIYYVSTSTGSDLTGDGSQGNPWATIQHAINTVTGTEAGPIEIRVAEGTYSENVVLDDYESLYGGYDPSDWTRDIQANETTISGGIVGGTLNEVTVDGFTCTGHLSFDGSTPTIRNCTLSGIIELLTAMNGIISDCTFSGTDGIMGGYGTTITGCTFSGDGNGVAIDPIYADVSDSTFSGYATAIECGSTNGASLQKCTISGCVNGVIVGGESSVTLENCLLYGNTKGISASGFDRTLNVTNCTIVGNTEYGITASCAMGGCTESIINCVIWNNGDDLDGCTVTYSDISDGDAGTGNISADPIFLDASNGDYRLTSGSPCIDTGADTGLTEDFEGDPRPLDGNSSGTAEYDMGADEFMDTDGDGLQDSVETGYGTDPDDADSDGDGLSDYEEVNYDSADGGYYPSVSDTDATNPNTDGDAWSDYLEVRCGGDPLSGGTGCETIRINFQPGGSSVPGGYARDSAQTYGAWGYGW